VLWSFAVFTAKKAKQQRLIAAISRERRKSSRKVSSREGASVLFDVTASNSGPVSEVSADQLTLQSLRRFDVAPHFVFAYRKTGLLVTVENETFMSEADLMRWDAAMLEYFQIERKTKAGATSSMRH